MGLSFSHLYYNAVRFFHLTGLDSRWAKKWSETIASKLRGVFRSSSWTIFVAITYLITPSNVRAQLNDNASLESDTDSASNREPPKNESRGPNGPESEPQLGLPHLSFDSQHVVVRSIGDISPAALQASCHWIRNDLGLSCSTIPYPQPDEKSLWSKRLKIAWEPNRQQFDGKELINQLFYNRSQRLAQGYELAPIELWISAKDIYEGERPFVFGLTSLTDRVAIISTARLSAESTQGPSRLRKLILHELGHAFGLHHHEVSNCAMRVDDTVESLDRAPQVICSICKKTIEEGIYAHHRWRNIEFEIALGHLVRGDFIRADNIARKYILNSQPQLSLQLAMAFARAQANDYAIAWFEFTLEEPEIQNGNQAPIHLALARSFERRKRNHYDILQAKRHFKRAVELRPKWNLALDELQRFLNSLEQEKLAVASEATQLCILPSTSC